MGPEGDEVPLRRALSLVVVVAVVGALAPPAAFAHGSRGGHLAGSSRTGGGFAHKRFAMPQESVFPQPVDPWKFWGTSHAGRHHHGGRHVPFAPFVSAPGFIGTPSVVVTTPAFSEVIQGSTVVYVPPAVSAPAAGLAFGGAPTLPTPALVEHPSGWYQLRGDGMTTPYSWVWIPKAPAPPGPSTEPAPSAPGSAAPPRSADSRTRDDRGPAYHWTDGGVTTWTNRLERVPKHFRNQAAATAQPD
jgi:hypothetical protein